MPVSELPPPSGYRFNTGIGVLPQFRQPAIDPSDPYNPLNTDIGQPPAVPDFSAAWRTNAALGGRTAPGGIPSWRDNASLGNTGYPIPGTGQDWRSNATGATVQPWRTNATYAGNPSTSLFGKIGNLLGGIGGSLGNLFSGGDPNSTPPSDTPPGMPPGQGYGAGGIPMKTWQEVFNTGRFQNAPSGYPTLAQAQFPGSMIGPTSGSVSNPYNPYAPSVTGKGGSHSGLFGATSAFQNYINAHTTR